MKRALGLVLIGLVFLVGYNWQVARATITCTLPFTLQNNTTADANQVMANYNALVTCFTQAASAGINSDITSLVGLSTPLPAASGGAQTYVGGTSTGSANAQVVASATPSNFVLGSGRKVTFIAGFSNTAATTLNVNATGAKNVYRRTQLGVSASVGGEIVSGQLVEVVYDGTQYQLTNVGPVQVGEIRDYGGTTAPTGWSFIDGSAVSRTTFADLFTVIGTNFGVGDGSTTFNLPDGRGRALFGRDDMGGSAASRLTNAGSSCVGTTLGVGCGQQNRTIAQANIPAYNFNLTGISVSGITNTTQTRSIQEGAGAGRLVAVDSSIGTGTSTAVNALSGSVGGTLGTDGSGTALATIPALQVVNKIIRY